MLPCLQRPFIILVLDVRYEILKPKKHFSLPAASRFYLWWKPRSVAVAFSWVVADQILPPQVQFESEFFLGYLEKFPRNDWEISSMKCEMLWNRKIGFISLSFWAPNFHQHFCTHSYLADMHFINFLPDVSTTTKK